MKNRKFARAITLVLSCLLLVGAALGISAIAAPSGASAVEIAYKNVSYTGAPRLVLYTDTDKPLAANQEVKVLFWNEAPENGVYNELTADYERDAESSVIIDGKQHKAFIADGVAPSELRKTIYIRPVIVEIDGDGKEKVTALGKLEEYSIFDYAVDMFASRAGATVDQYAMYSQLLDYAAAIQKVLFTNEDGSLNEEKLAEVGGWANAYYIAEVEKYLKDPKTGELVALGESDRQYFQSSSVRLEAELYKTVGETEYMFYGFRNADGSAIGSVLNDGKVTVIATPEGYNKTDVSVAGVGVTYFMAVYGRSAGDYATYDGGTDRGSFNSDSDYWKQFFTDADSTSSVYNGDMSTAQKGTIYEYYVRTDNGQEKEIPHFYAADGVVSNKFSDYMYIYLDVSKTGLDTIVTDKMADYLSSNSNAELVAFNIFEDFKKEDLQNTTLKEITAYVEKAGVYIVRKAVQVHIKGNVSVVDDPFVTSSAEQAANKVVRFTKHVYNIAEGEASVITNAGNAYNMNLGYVPYIGHINSTSGSPIVVNNSIKFNNQSPTTYYNGGDYVTNIFETDLYVDSNTGGILTEVYLHNAADKSVWAFNIQVKTADGTVYLGLKEGPGYAENNKIYHPNGNSVGAQVIAGSNGSVTAGKEMYCKRWYKLRIEYVAEADNKATVKIYVDGELCSYIRDDAHMVSGSYLDDDYLSKVLFRHNNATRDTRIYMDNVYLASLGDTEQVKIEFDDGREDYLGKGLYYKESEKFPFGFTPGSTSHKVVTEKDKDGNELDNTILELHKTSQSTSTTVFRAEDSDGGIYVFETDFKIIGSDNTSSWLMKMQLLNEAKAGDNAEFGMVCLKYKQDLTGTYWTISNQDTEFKDASGNIYKGVLDKWYNLRFEYNPVDRSTKIYLNGEYFTTVTIPLTGSGSKDNSVFAGVGFVLRAYPAGTKYTKMYIDNTIATTLDSDSIGVGEYYDKSEHYDGYDVGGNTGVELESDGANKYINITGGTLTEILTENRGHAYVYETDIKWNGITFESDDDESAGVLSLKLYSGDNAFLNLTGTANKGDDYLYLKAGNYSAGKLKLGYWSNLRVVYAPTEPETVETELEDGSIEQHTVYGGTYEIYVNGGLVWSGTVADMSEDTIYVDNTAFDKAELTVGSDAGSVSVFIDNTYTEASFVDDIGKGDNASSSETFEKDESEGVNQVVTSATVFDAASVNGVNTVETKLKLEWNGNFATATSTANVATIDLLDKDGNIITSIDCNVNKVTGRVDILDMSVALDEWYTFSVVSLPDSGKYVIAMVPDNDSETPVFSQLTAPTAEFAAVKLSAGENTVIYTDGKDDDFITDKLLIPTTGTAGTAYSFNADLAVSWNGVLANGASAEVAAFSFVDILGREFFRITANAVKDNSGKVTVDICVNGQKLKNIDLDTLWTLALTAENGNYAVTLTLISDNKNIATASYELEMSETFAGVVVSVADGAAIELQNASCGLQNEYNRVDGNANVTHEIVNSETVGVTHIYETDIRVYWNGLLAAGELSRKVFEITLADSKGEGFFTIYGVAKADKPGYVTLSLTEDGEGGFYELPAGVWYNVKVEISDDSYSVTVKGKVRASGDIALPLDFVKAVTIVSADAVVDTDNTYLKTENESLKGKGDNSSNAIGNYETSVENGDIEYDPALGEFDPDDEFTDAYIEMTKTQITMGKQTAAGSNVLTFLSSSAGKNTLYVFETDIYWQGSVLGSVSGTESVFHEISLLGNTVIDGESVEVVLATVYAVGVCAVDTVATDVQYLLLYTSLEEGSEPVAVIRQDLWYNLRMEYDAANGDTTVFVNNTSVATVDGDVIEGVSFAGTEIKLGDDVYDTVIKLQKTYIAAVPPASKNS